MSSPGQFEHALRDAGPEKGVFPSEVRVADWQRTGLMWGIWTLISKLKVSSKVPLFIFWLRQLRGSRLNHRMSNRSLAQATAQAAARQSAPVEPAARPPPAPIGPRHFNSGSDSPWAWMEPLSSTIYLHLKDGSVWVRVQRKDGKHLLAAWPVFDGWDEALPPHVGAVDTECEGCSQGVAWPFIAAWASRASASAPGQCAGASQPCSGW